LLLLATALFLGFLHGLGADHLMAIAALSVDGRVTSPAARRTRAIGMAMRFAAGHALLLGLGAGLIVLIGWSIPDVVERGGEMLGGVLLVAMGGVGLWGVLSGRVYGHTHVHDHEPRAHWHLHVGRRDHHPSPSAHSHLPTMIGAAFAVSSLRALAMLTPFGAGLGTAPLPLLLALILVFAVGILMSMSLFGVALARLLSTQAIERIGQGAGLLVGVSSVVLGVAWIVTA
jgi:hypothetical protein